MHYFLVFFIRTSKVAKTTTHAHTSCTKCRITQATTSIITVTIMDTITVIITERVKKGTTSIITCHTYSLLAFGMSVEVSAILFNVH